jgi:hypothetical protein
LQKIFYYLQALLKNGPCYLWLWYWWPKWKKLCRKRNGSKNTTNLGEHIIFVPSTHLWAMGNFYFSSGNLFFFLIDSVRVFFLIVMTRKTVPFDNGIFEKKREIQRDQQWLCLLVMKQLMQQKIVYDATSFINDILDTSFMLGTSEALRSECF